MMVVVNRDAECVMSKEEGELVITQEETARSVGLIFAVLSICSLFPITIYGAKYLEAEKPELGDVLTAGSSALLGIACVGLAMGWYSKARHAGQAVEGELDTPEPAPRNDLPEQGTDTS